MTMVRDLDKGQDACVGKRCTDDVETVEVEVAVPSKVRSGLGWSSGWLSKTQITC